MKRIESIEELHVILLDMAKAFHAICEEEGIPYYMIGGTLLGAVRHKGFIPWDDDMDFGVPRSYYDRLKDVLCEKLPDCYSVLTEDDGIVASGFFKIVDNRTIQSHQWDEDSEKQFGVNIDIFPLDRVKNKWKRKLIDILLKIQGYKLFDATERPFLKRVAARIVKFLFFWQKRDGMTTFIEKYLVEKDGSFITNNYGIYGSRETVPADYFGKPTTMVFEDTQLCGVEKPHDYLSSIYGEYMKLPPKEKQHIHIIDMYWK